LILYAISHILMQKFKHEIFFKTVFYKYLLIKNKLGDLKVIYKYDSHCAESNDSKNERF
jgi:hypothetical protein